MGPVSVFQSREGELTPRELRPQGDQRSRLPAIDVAVGMTTTGGIQQDRGGLVIVHPSLAPFEQDGDCPTEPAAVATEGHESGLGRPEVDIAG